MATCHAIYDLAARPEYVEPLREEINQVLQEDGYDLDGEGNLKLKKMSMPKLRLLDSFLKETQRLSPPGLSMLHLKCTLTPSADTFPSFQCPLSDLGSYIIYWTHPAQRHPLWNPILRSPYLHRDASLLPILQPTRHQTPH
jgi:cytochrome P450